MGAETRLPENMAPAMVKEYVEIKFQILSARHQGSVASVLSDRRWGGAPKP